MLNSFEILTSSHEIDQFLALLIILKDQLAKTIIDNDYYNECKNSFVARKEQYLADQNPRYYENFSYENLFWAAQLKAEHEEQYHQASNKLKEVEDILNNSLKNLINVIFLIINKSIDDKIDVLDFIDKHREFDLGLLVNIIPMTSSKIDSSNMGEQLSKKIVESFYENVEKIEAIKTHRAQLLNKLELSKEIKNKQLSDIEKSIENLKEKIYFNTDNKILNSLDDFFKEFQIFYEKLDQYEGKYKFIFNLYYRIIVFSMLALFFYGCSQKVASSSYIGIVEIVSLFIAIALISSFFMSIPFYFFLLLKLVFFCSWKVKEYFKVKDNQRVVKIKNTIKENKNEIELILIEINNNNEAFNYFQNPISYIEKFIKSQ